MLRNLLLATLVVAAGLSGCLEAPASTDAPDGSTPLASGTSPLVGRVEDWYTMAVDAAPAAALAGFWWTVPEGAPVKDQIFSYDGKTYESVILEVALLGDEEDLDPIQEWGLLAFIKHEGALTPIAEVLSTPIHTREAALMGGDAGTQDIFTAPFILRLGPDAIEAGDEVGFVLTARTAEPLEVRLGFRVLPKDPGFDEEPAEDSDGFLAALGGRAPIALPVAGAGEGFQAAMYLEFSGHFIFPFSGEMWTDAVRLEGGVSPDLRPAGGQRDQSISASFDSPAGYASSVGVYFASHAVGSWAAEAEMRGESLTAGGPVVHSPHTSLASYVLFGFPAFLAVGDGEGASASAMRVQTTSTSVGGFEVLAFSQLDLGATLTTLLGKESLSGTSTFPGLMSDASLRAHEGHLTFRFPESGLQRTLLGIVPA